MTTTIKLKELSPREWDVLVAEKVMDFKVVMSTTGSQYFIHRKEYVEPSNPHSGYSWNEHIGELPQYTTNISDAWTVIEKLESEGILVHISRFKDNTYGDCWGVDMCKSTLDCVSVMAKTVTEAICMAALKVKGVEIE